MKYFTLDWWRGDADVDLNQYHSYINSIRLQLPEDLAEFIDEVGLHDAQVIGIHLNIPEKRLELLLKALFPSDGPADFEHHNLQLIYEGVFAFDSIASPQKALGGPGGYGELGYDEIELLGESLFEHRLLFSSGIELQIGFGNVKWQRMG